MVFEYMLASKQSNYNVAINYYSQKRKALESMLKLKIDTGSYLLVDKINEAVDKYQEEVVSKIYANIFGNSNNLSEIKNIQSTLKWSTPMNKVLSTIINQDQINYQTLQANLGYGFEDFLKNSLGGSDFISTVVDFANKNADSLISGIVGTGSKGSTGATVSGIKNIRPDLGLGMSALIQDSSGVLRDERTGIAVELQTLIDLGEINESIEDLMNNESLRETLMSQMYGFSLKLWKSNNSQGKEFTSSSQLYNIIQNKFDKQRTHTWNSTYANEYVVYQLSRYITNIIGPINVAMIMGNGFMWMDDFLSSREFYMRISMGSPSPPVKSERGNGYEIHPNLVDSAILLRNSMINNSRITYSTYMKKSKKNNSWNLIAKRKIIKT